MKKITTLAVAASLMAAPAFAESVKIGFVTTLTTGAAVIGAPPLLEARRLLPAGPGDPAQRGRAGRAIGARPRQGGSSRWACCHCGTSTCASASCVDCMPKAFGQ